ncbi:MAG: 50S ribosomal protein L9 [Thiotrichales bacterium]
MEIILLDKVENLGDLGDKVKVRSGYARNFLIPSGKAKFATAANIAEFEARRAELEKQVGERLAGAQARKAAMVDLVVTVMANAGNEGKLFGSVGPGEIADAATAAGVPVEKREVRLPEGPIRTLGEFEVVIHLHTELDTTIKVNVVPEA